jgi:hypothetical protein
VRINFDGLGKVKYAAVQVSFVISGAATHDVGTGPARIRYDGRVVVGYRPIHIALLKPLIAAIIVGYGEARRLRLSK